MGQSFHRFALAARSDANGDRSVFFFSGSWLPISHPSASQFELFFILIVAPNLLFFG